MSELDPSKLNIFEPTHSSDFNACVGTNSLHDMRTYAEGYLQASTKLLDEMFAKKMVYERDTLVHPILYLARHSIELSIKHVLIKLNETDIQTEERKIHGHNLKELWELFKTQTAFDRRIIEVVEAVDPIVTQLDHTDPDAQDFRYPVNTDGNQTLDGKFIVDLVTVKQLVDYLGDKLLYLYNITETIVDERNLNSFTKEFNREELKQLSIELPDIDTWTSNIDFEMVKASWIEKYELSNSGFSRAIDFIKSHREFSGNINNEHEFIAVDEGLLEELVKKSYEIKLEYISDRKLEFKDRMSKPEPAYVNYPLFESRLTPNVLSELNALFYLSRGNEISDAFDFMVEHFGKEFKGLGDIKLDDALKRSFIHIFEKTNFINEIVGGLKKIGRLELADKLSEYIVIEEVDFNNLGEMMEFK